jgi:hypothetical protein
MIIPLQSMKKFTNVLHLYLNRKSLKTVQTFQSLHQRKTSFRICKLIEQDVETNIKLDIPMIRVVLNSRPKDIKRLKELLEEYD